ncbi:amino acid/polyamine/organocation transporter, APC superfamily [Chitinophaga costaii]|uniref:Amino acid/polyamine/organocation transporter, APC superfamily n=1 Tax=Chitinophaga costaii TaxID=1335309 RepID=A0A1C4AJW0_9BACT|nr:amino acid permease [Chitinophaga costaii]PUZ26634.1 amino acid permease [Chitinophaga costaii]SCB94853.1 amino acid/polyamine/organocation transporter, APC superfamily [Chitinophaga costaii]
MGQIFKKPLNWLIQESVTDNTHTLKRSLSAFQLVTLGLGVIIGAGLFSLTGLAAANNAGPAVTLSFVVSAVGCCFAGLCYAEFSSMIPVAGSAYTYAYATMGELLAWIIGWDLVLEFSVGGATVAISWSNYLTEFLRAYNIHLPVQLLRSPFESVKLADGSLVNAWFNLPALLVVVAMSLLLMRGTRGSAIWNAIVVSLKVGVVLVFIALGWKYIQPANYHPYIPINTGHFGEYGWSGILRGAGVIFFVYLGFDMVSTAAQEAKNPQRNMPIGILGSLALCTILFLLFSHVLTGLAPYREFKDSAAPVAVALKHTPYIWLSQVVLLAIIVGYTSVILVDLLAQSRVFYAMANDGLLPPVFAAIHSRYRTPWKSNMLLCVFVGGFAALVPLKVVGEMTSIGTLLAFVIVCLGVWIMRVKMPDVPRAFKTPWVPFVPIMGVLVCVVMMVSLPKETWLRLVIWMGAGLAIYYLYGRKNSKVQKHYRSK